MKTNYRAFIAALCAYALPAISQMPPSPVAPASTMQHAMPQTEMHKSTTGMTGSDSLKKSMMIGMYSMDEMKMTGDTDKDFAMMMKIHHQQAVDMSEMLLAHGKSPAMKTIALNIIAAQKKEIAMFDKWLDKQK